MKQTIFLILLLLFQQTTNPQTTNKITLNDAETNWLNQHKDSISYAPNPSWPPGDYIDENGEHKGIISDYIKIFEQNLGIKFNNKYYKNWHDITHAVEEGKVDFTGGMMYTNERTKLYNFTDVFLNIPIVILIKNDHWDDFDKSDIPNMKLASVEGYISQDYIKDNYPGVIIKEFENDLNALIQTSLGNTDGTIVDLMTASFLIEKYGINNLSIGIELDFSWELCFAFNKDEEILASIINKVLSTIDDEQRREIFNQWVNIKNIEAPNYFKRHLKRIIIIGTLILIVIIMFLNYTIILRKQVKRRTQELNRELEEKNKAITLSKKNESRIKSLFEIANHKTESITHLLDYALAEAVTLTDSKTGILFTYIEKNKTFRLSNFQSSETEMQILTNLKSEFSFSDFGTCLNKKNPKSFIIDSCLTKNKKKNRLFPIDSLSLNHTLLVPVYDDGKPEFIILLANKTSEYDESDAKQVLLLMNSVIKLISKQRWQNELIRAKEKAEESDHLKSAFLANLSHEIRTPMNGILGFTELLNEPDLSSEEKDKYVQLIHKNGNYLLSIITDIIEISKIETGQVRINYSDVLINTFVKEITDNIRLSIPENKDIKLVLNGINVPDTTSILTDKLKLQQILSSLISNAIKFTNKGLVTIEYQLIQKNMIEFTVTDTGIGIEEKYHDIIFNRFRQVEVEYTKISGGSGLGLAICKSYVEMLGGKISLHSTFGEGTTFTFNIPTDIRVEVEV